MRWIKHDTDANMDAKLRHLRLKYGMEAYGLYWYCLERIAVNISISNISLELDYDSILISTDTGISIERIELMIRYMVDIRLFEQSKGRITCMRIARRLDKSMTSNKLMRELIVKLRHQNDKEISISPDAVMTESGTIMQEERRGEENILSIPIDSINIDKDFDKFWSNYPRKENKADALRAFKRLSAPSQQIAIEDVLKRWLRWNDDDKRYVPGAGKYLRNELWNDPIKEGSAWSKARTSGSSSGGISKAMAT